MKLHYKQFLDDFMKKQAANGGEWSRAQDTRNLEWRRRGGRIVGIALSCQDKH